MTGQEFKETLAAGGFVLRPMPGQAVLAQPTDFQIVDRATDSAIADISFDTVCEGTNITMRNGYPASILYEGMMNHDI